MISVITNEKINKYRLSEKKVLNVHYVLMSELIY